MNTRLNKNTREQLLDFAQKTAKIDPAITKRFEQAIKAADKTVAAGLKKSYPTKDMKVLKKYGTTQIDTCVHVVTEEGTSQLAMYTFSKKELCPPTPSLVGCRYSRKAHWLGQEAADAVIEFESASLEKSTAQSTLFRDFSSLIHKAKTFEELVEQWPPFKDASEIFNSGALMVMSDEVLDRISGYSAESKAA